MVIRSSNRTMNTEAVVIHVTSMSSNDTETNTSEAECIKVARHHLAFDIEDYPCYNRQQVLQILFDLVITLSTILDFHKIDYWMDSGTLLGSYRDNGLLPWDYDADFGVTEESFIKIRDDPSLLNNIPSGFFLEVLGSNVHRQGYRDPPLPARYVHQESAMYIDIFKFKEFSTSDDEPELGPLASGCWGACAYCNKVVVDGNEFKEFRVRKDWIFPLTTCNFHWRPVKCPAQSRQYLTYLFGPQYDLPPADLLNEWRQYKKAPIQLGPPPEIPNIHGYFSESWTHMAQRLDGSALFVIVSLMGICSFSFFVWFVLSRGKRMRSNVVEGDNVVKKTIHASDTLQDEDAIPILRENENNA